MSNLVLYLISDSIGETAEQVVKSVISQYDLEEYEIRKYPHIVKMHQLRDVIELAKIEQSIVIYTLVNGQLSSFVEKECKLYRIPSIDLMNPLLNAIAYRTNLQPLREPGVNRKLDAHYFKRVDAIEFAVKYDDGKDPRGLLKADLVLIGVSRTSKTPLSMYLANKYNLKVANLPLVPEVSLPKEMSQVPSYKVIGLTNSPEKLNIIRRERLQTLGLLTGSSYATMERILEELEYAEGIMKQLGCPIIDVSTKAIEETASIIVNLNKENE